MKHAITIISISASLLLAAAAGYAAQDYNSSRSNRGVAADAPDLTETLIRESASDALSLNRRLFEVDRRDGYEGEYEITVNVSISFERVESPVQ